MPKKNKKSNPREVADDFDDMLADFRAADLTNTSPSQAAPIAGDGSAIKVALTKASGGMIPEATVLAAITAGNATKLRRWHRLGLQISAHIMCKVAASRSINAMSAMSFLVEELGADVNGAADGGATPLLVTSLSGRLDFVRFLVRTLGADVNKGDRKGMSPLCCAAQSGFIDVVRCLV
jgi:ankyrin repeat protein